MIISIWIASILLQAAWAGGPNTLLKEIDVFKLPTSGLRRVFYSPDPSRVYTVGGEDGIIGWDIRTGKPGDCHSKGFYPWSAISPDGSRVLAAQKVGYGTFLSFLNPSNGQIVETGFRRYVRASHWSRDSRRLLVLDGFGDIWIFNAETGVHERVLTVERAVHVSWNEDETRVLTIEEDGRYRSWSLDYKWPMWLGRRRELGVLKFQGKELGYANVSPDGSKAVIRESDYQLPEIWDLRNMERVSLLEKACRSRLGFHLTDSKLLCIEHNSHIASLFDLGSGRRIASFECADGESIDDAALSPDGKSVAIVSGGSARFFVEGPGGKWSPLVPPERLRKVRRLLDGPALLRNVGTALETAEERFRL